MITYSIIKKSQLEGANRLDAEYYEPKYLNWDSKIKQNKHARFGDIIKFLTDYTSNSSFAGLRGNVRVTDEPSYAKWVRIQNLDNEDFNTNIRYVDEKSYNFLKKSKLSGGEILISKTGEYLGRGYIMSELSERTTLADNIFLIYLKDETLKEFLVCFVNSVIGRSLLLRRLQGTGQPTIIKESIRDYLIPIPDEAFKNFVKSKFLNAKEQSHLSQELYSQAEELILEELEMKDYQHDSEISNVVSFADVKSVKRMDAEYFQPKYAKLEKKIKEHNAQRLGDLVTVKKGFEPGAEAYLEKGKLFIRVSSLTKLGIIDKDQKYLSDNLYKELKKDYEPKVGEILLTKDASPGTAYVVKEPVEGIISGGIVRLKLKEQNIEPEYLALCISSIVGQAQAQRDAGGSVIMHWKPEQIKNLLVPVLSQNTQKKISDLVHQSHEARKKAKELLEEAKHKVEELIEKGNLN